MTRFTVSLVTLCWMLHGLQARDTEQSPHDPAALIEQLGSSEFLQRERAENQLFELGIACRAALEKAKKHEDPEIRTRCARILKQLLDRETRRLFLEFEKDTDGSLGTSLPGWPAFAKLFGDAARPLYLRMQRVEYFVLEQLAAGSDPNELLLEILSRHDYTNLAYRIPDSPQRVGFAATMLYLLHLSSERIDPILRERMGVIATTALEKEVDAKNNDALRKMTELWVYREIPDLARDYQYRLVVALKWKVASRLVNDALTDPTRFGPQIKATAILAAARNKQLLEFDPVLISSYLYDESAVMKVRSNGGALRHPLELRDCALFYLILSSNQDPADYGFSSPKELLQTPMAQGLDLSELHATFISSERRTAAVERWNDWILSINGQDWLDECKQRLKMREMESGQAK
jgi:hypothetical protein